MILRLLVSSMLSLTVIFSGYGQLKSTGLEKRADRYYAHGSYHQSIKVYSRVIEKYPENEGVRLKLARNYFHLGWMTEAEVWYSLVIHKRYLVESKDYLNYAKILQSNQNYSLAEKWAHKYLDYHPRDVIAQNIVYWAINRGSPDHTFTSNITGAASGKPSGAPSDLDQNNAVTNATLLKVKGVSGTKSYVLLKAGTIEVKDTENNPSNWLEVLLRDNNIRIERMVNLEPIFYQQDQISIDGKFQNDLIELAELMKRYEFLQLEVSGYSDTNGAEQYNQELSERRAAEVLHYLGKLGIARDRLLGIGYGEFNTNQQQGDSFNGNNKIYNYDRRTEFRLIYMDDDQVVSNY